MLKKYLFSFILLFSLVLNVCCASNKFHINNESYKRNAYNSVMMLDIMVQDAAGDINGVSGTAFAIDDKHLITAGHLCISALKMSANAKSLKIIIFAINNNEELMFQDDVKDLKIMAIDQKNDLCLIIKPRHGLKPVKLSKKQSVKIRDQIFIVGAPSGEFPIETEGFVSLPKVAIKNANEKVMASIDIFSGNSGSPVFDDAGEVIGVLVMGDNTYTHIGYFTQVTFLKTFIKAALEQ